jgi:uncharacterized protein (TIGR03083 family)
MTTESHSGVPDLLGAWALGAIDEDELAVVEDHLRICATCATEARRLEPAVSRLAAQEIHPPPGDLLPNMLAEARRRRPPTFLRTLVQAYVTQVELLDEVLRGFRSVDWRQPDPRHGDVRGLIVHLARNDAMLAADVGAGIAAPAQDDVRGAWREQSRLLTARLTDAGDAGTQTWPALVLDRPARLAARSGPVTRHLRDALVQRSFEAWTHRDDLAEVSGRALDPPPPDQVRRIVDLAVRLLPGVLADAGVEHPGCGVRLLLDNSGDGEWTVRLGRQGPVERIIATVRADAVGFTRLVAGRCTVADLGPTVTGDVGVGHRMLAVASTLGCD